MKVAVVGHSLIHVRQQAFFRVFAALGHDVTLFSPGEWSTQRTQNKDENSLHIRTLRHFGGEDVYRFQLIGLKDALASQEFDVVYVQQEPSSEVAWDVLKAYEDKRRPKLAIFTWENITELVTPFARDVASQYDLVVCGNKEAQDIIKHSNTLVLPQVGIDTDHFATRDIKRDISVAYIGRPTQEKGLEKLLLAWPTARVLPWVDYLQLPWFYSQCKLVVCYSQDTPRWKEQAMPYVSMEGMCCGAFAIVSNGGSIPFWHREFAGWCEGSDIIHQDNTVSLKNQVRYWLDYEEKRQEHTRLGREWIIENLSSKVIARRLADALGS